MTTEKRNIVNLGVLLWSWKACDDCVGGQQCKATACPGRRSDKLRRYYQFCEAVLRPNSSDELFEGTFMRDDSKHLKVLQSVKSDPEITREALRQMIWSSDGRIGALDAPVIIGNAIRIMTTVDSSPIHQNSQLLESGDVKIPWIDGVPLSKFLEDAFSKENDHLLNLPNHQLSVELKNDLRADRLKQRLGISFQGTSDLRNHLKLNQTSQGLVLEVFHHVTYLREQLRMTKETPQLNSFSESIKVCVGLQISTSLQIRH